MTRRFIADITPYFYARPVVYVDGGTHAGKALRAFVDSSPPLREPHLIEPPAFAELRRTVEALHDQINRIRLHNVALGTGPGHVAYSEQR